MVHYAPHLQNTQFLEEILNRADELWCFGTELTDGMRQELRYAIEHDIPIKYFNAICQEVKKHE